MSSDPNVFAGTWNYTTQTPDGNEYPTSINIQVNPDQIRVVFRNPQGDLEAENVVFGNGELDCSLPAGGVSVLVRLLMRQDGNIDVHVDYNGMKFLSVGSRVVDNN
jgi:hypothetical protein